MRPLVVTVLSLSLAACASDPASPSASALATAPLLSGEAAIAATSLAFGRDGDALVASGRGWRARVTADAIRIGARAPERGAALRADLARDGWQCAHARREPRVLVDGALERPICAGVVDRIEARTDGIAWSWEFDRVPGGHGDLTVAIDVDGASMAPAQGATRLSPSSGDPSLIVSHATWIDAGGARTEIPLRPRGAALVATLTADLLARSRFPAVLDPTIGPEVRVDEPVAHHLADGNDLRLAWNGTHFLAVWVDGTLVGGSDIRAARIDASGVPIDPFGFAIDDSPAWQSEPRVAWTGTHFVVSYRDETQYEARRVAPDGTVIDTVPHVLGTSLSSPGFRNGDLVMVGSTLFWVWAGPYVVYAQRFDPNTLSPLDAAPIVVATSTTFVSFPAAGTDGTRLLATWMTGSGPVVRGRLVAESGALEGPGEIPISGLAWARESRMAVVWDGSAFDVLYYNTPMHLVRVAPTGVLLTSTPITLSMSVDTRASIGAAWDGSRLWAMAMHRPSIGVYETAIISVDPTAATPVSSAPVRIGGGPRTGTVAALAHGGTTLQGVWSDSSSTLWATRIGTDGSALDVPHQTLSRSSNAQMDPDVAWNGSSYLVAWRDLRVEGSGVYAVRVTREGTALDPIGRLIGGDGTHPPEIVAVGSSWVVLWDQRDPVTGTTDRYARVVGPDGVPRESTVRMPIPRNALPASDGTSLRFAYNVSYDAYTRGFDLDLTPLGDAVLADDAAAPRALAWIDSRWALLSIGQRTTAARPSLALLSPSGAPLAPPIGIAPSSNNVLDGWVTRDPEGMLVTWIDRASLPEVPTAARYAPDGSVLMAPRAILSTGFVRTIHPVFDGVDYVLSPHDSSLTQFTPFGAFLSREAAYLPGSPFPLATSTQMTYRVEVASDGAGSSVFAWSGEAPEVPYRTWRVRLRFTSNRAPLGAACADSIECDSGLCVDGVCCDTACGGGAPDDCAACSIAAGASADGACELLGPTVSCRPATGACDAPELCDGSEACPPDQTRIDGTACGDAIVCNGAETCSAGACVSAPALDCDLGDVCSTYACEEPTGCVAIPVPGCCRADADCADVSVCTADTCSTSDGVCSHAPIPGCCEVDSECDDGDSCTVDRCASNACEHAASTLCVDAGRPDAGQDAGQDAGRDAGPPARDAGIAVDGGPPAPVEMGCSCRIAARASVQPWVFVAIALAAWGRTRRRTRARARASVRASI